MPIGAVIGGTIGAVGSVGSALIGSNAASSASKAQVAADQAALATQVSGENTALRAQAPYNDIGTGAIHSLADLYGLSYAGQGNGLAHTSGTGVITPANSNAANSSPGGQAVSNAAMANFTNTPDYQFALQQGTQALDRSAAAKGLLLSGGQVKGAQEFGQGLASQQFGNYFNRLLSLAQIGQSAASGVASTATNSANSQAQTQQGIGTAQGAGAVGSANVLSGGLTGVGSNITQSLLVSKLLPNSSPSAFSGSGGTTSSVGSPFNISPGTGSSSLWNYDVSQVGG